MHLYMHSKKEKILMHLYMHSKQEKILKHLYMHSKQEKNSHAFIHAFKARKKFSCIHTCI